VNKESVKENCFLLQEYLFKTLIFLLPTQLAYHFWPEWAYVFGVRVDYLSPAVYLTDVLLALIILCWIFSGIINEKESRVLSSVLSFRKHIILVLIFAVLNIFFAASFWAALFRWIKIVLFVLITIYIKFNRRLDIKDWILKPLMYSAVLFSSIGILQFINQQSLGGVLYYLGERTFFSTTPGIAKVSLFGRQYLRGYSTFSHPNSFAGYLLAVFCLVNFSKIRINALWKKIFLFFVLTGILIAFSKSVYLSLLMIFLILLTRRSGNIFRLIIYLFLMTSIILSLSLPFISDYFLRSSALSSNIFERLYLAFLAGLIFAQKPFLGTGLNNFIVKAYQLMKGRLILQPVHNLYLLLVSEIGVVGLIIFLYLLKRIVSKLLLRNRLNLLLTLVVILSTGFADHYWITLQQNILFASVFLGLSFRD
jgi:O-antigen ligase